MIRIALNSGAEHAPALGQVLRMAETDTLWCRGLSPGATVQLGPVFVRADAEGSVGLLPAAIEDLQCQIGRLPLVLPELGALEVDVRPGKLTEDAYHTLRAELENVWIGLTLDPTSPTAVPAKQGVPPADIWQALEAPVRDIAQQPRRTLQPVYGPLEVRELRSVAGLSPVALVHARLGARTVQGRRLEHGLAVADLALVVDTLQRLAAKARRWPDVETEERIAAYLTRPPFAGLEPATLVTHGARHDPRYRAVAAVRNELTGASSLVTEGPGEFRLGIRALDRLYEYWVFLRVLLAATEQLGAPDALDLAQLATRSGEDHLRLELVPGTTVAFPGEVQIVFEPNVGHQPDLSWGGLELPVHPDSRYQRNLATPDVIVFCGATQRALVLDAKYRGRKQIDLATFEVHTKYARLRREGRGVVETVLVVHPHEGFGASYAGCGHMGWCPGRDLPRLPWERILPAAPPSAPVSPILEFSVRPAPTPRVVTAPAPGVGAKVALVAPLPVRAAPPKHAVGTLLALGTGPVIVADQRWMRQVVGDRRIDLRALSTVIAPTAQAFMLAPRLASLASFMYVCERAGWIILATTLDRSEQLGVLRELAEGVAERELIVVSGDPAFEGTARLAARCRIVDDLEGLDIWMSF